MVPAIRKESQTAEPAIAPASPRRAKMPAPTIAPTPRKAAPVTLIEPWPPGPADPPSRSRCSLIAPNSSGWRPAAARVRTSLRRGSPHVARRRSGGDRLGGYGLRPLGRLRGAGPRRQAGRRQERGGGEERGHQQAGLERTQLGFGVVAELGHDEPHAHPQDRHGHGEG